MLWMLFIWNRISYHDVYLNLINVNILTHMWAMNSEQGSRNSCTYSPSFGFCFSRFLTRSVYCKYSARLANVSCVRMNACVPLLKSDNDLRNSLLTLSWFSSEIVESEISQKKSNKMIKLTIRWWFRFPWWIFAAFFNKIFIIQGFDLFCLVRMPSNKFMGISFHSG